MHTLRLHFAAILALGVAVFNTPASAQAKPDVPSLRKTDIALSIYGTWSEKASQGAALESPSNAAGGMFELRYLKNPLLGFEGTYSFNRANENFSAGVCPVGTVPPCPSAQSIKANAHEVTGDWVPSVKLANLRPFGVLGVGVLLNVPSGGQSMTKNSTTPVYVYGAGLDWGLLPHIGLRLQYRGNLYKAPDVTTLFTSVDKFTHTSEPMAGVYFRF
jgi:opacity protein-like surface antigen